MVFFNVFHFILVVTYQNELQKLSCLLLLGFFQNKKNNMYFTIRLIFDIVSLIKKKRKKERRYFI